MSKPIIAARDEAAAGHAEPAPSVRWALAGLSLSMLLSSLGTSIANVGLPTLAQAFDASFQQVQWVVLAYLLAITTLIVSVGRLGDIIGRRRLLLAGIVAVHRGLGPVRRRADARAADRRPRGAGPRRGDHDGRSPWRFVGATVPEGADRQRHGAARNDVRDRHRARAVARRRADRRLRLAGDLPRQRSARRPALCCSRTATCPPSAAAPKADRAGFDAVGHPAAGADARGLCARHDARGAAASARSTWRCWWPPSLGAGLFVLAEARAASPLDPAGDVPRSGAERGPRHERARLDGDDGDAGGRAVLSRARARARRRAWSGSSCRWARWWSALTGVPAGRVADRFGARRMTVVGPRRHGGRLPSLLSLLPATLGVAGYVAPDRRRHRRLRAVPDGQQHRRHGRRRRRTSGASSPACSTCRATSGSITGASVMGAVFALARRRPTSRRHAPRPSPPACGRRSRSRRC